MIGKYRYKIYFRAKLVLVHIVLFVACGESLEPKEYKKWMESPINGLAVDTQVSGYHFKLIYRPLEYVIWQEMGLKPQPGSAEWKEYARFQYFQLQVGSEQGEMLKSGNPNETEYKRRFEYFSSAVQKDFLLVDGRDTLRCRQVHLEPMYNLAPYNSFLLMFDRSKEEQDAVINETSYEYPDKVLIFNGSVMKLDPVKLKIAGSHLSQIPKLNIR